MTPTEYSLVSEYVNICCRTFSEEQFRKILDEDVTLSHTTNNNSPITAGGITPVVALFKKYIFENTSNVSIATSLIGKVGEKIELKLTVTEEKNENDKTNRYLFIETTEFKICQSTITSIESCVERISID